MRVENNNSVSATVLPALAVMLLCASAAAESAEEQSSRVLVLSSFRNSMPINADWYAGLVQGFSSATELRIEIDTEYPDLSSLGDSDYVDQLLDVYRHTYRERQPHLVIPVYTPALQFLLDHGESLFPGVPIVFLGADHRFLTSRQLAPNITGMSSISDIAGTLELALHVHPDTRQVALIVGSGDIGQHEHHPSNRGLRHVVIQAEGPSG